MLIPLMTDETGRRSTNLVAQSLETEHHLRLTDFTHEKSINSTAIIPPIP
jgi:hypothetical protein